MLNVPMLNSFDSATLNPVHANWIKDMCYISLNNSHFRMSFSKLSHKLHTSKWQVSASFKSGALVDRTTTLKIWLRFPAGRQSSNNNF